MTYVFPGLHTAGLSLRLSTTTSHAANLSAALSPQSLPLVDENLHLTKFSPVLRMLS